MSKTRLAIIALALTNVAIIAVLIYVKVNAEHHVELASQHLESLGNEEINHTVFVNTTIPLDTEIQVTEPIEVAIELGINQEVRIKADVPVRDIIQVPVNLRVKENIELDTTISVMERISVNLNTMIPVDQKFLIPRGNKGKGITIPIRASIPVNQDVDIGFNDPMRVQSTIGVDIPVQQTLDVEFEMIVPMDQNVLLNLPVKTTAMVSFLRPMKVKGEIPIKLEIPVVIALKDTPIKSTMENVASELRQLFPF
ncbi:MAG: hypothetical protein P8P74_05065 [Crocinitomicaceae bacterium]|nr:hypothetical protein [Crocinitomicaceae bacterium]